MEADYLATLQQRRLDAWAAYCKAKAECGQHSGEALRLLQEYRNAERTYNTVYSAQRTRQK